MRYVNLNYTAIMFFATRFLASHIRNEGFHLCKLPYEQYCSKPNIAQSVLMETALPLLRRSS